MNLTMESLVIGVPKPNPSSGKRFSSAVTSCNLASSRRFEYLPRRNGCKLSVSSTSSPHGLLPLRLRSSANMSLPVFLFAASREDSVS